MANYQIFEENKNVQELERKELWYNLLVEKMAIYIREEERMSKMISPNDKEKMAYIEVREKMFRLNEEMQSRMHYITIFREKILNDDENIKANLAEAKLHLEEVIVLAETICNLGKSPSTMAILNWVNTYKNKGGLPDNFNMCYGYIQLKNLIKKHLELNPNYIIPNESLSNLF